MPVITPAYPQMCATFNITHSTKAIIQRELERGAEITEKILNGKLMWKDLFVKHTFFTRDHKYYLAVIITSTTKEAHKVWSGFVESKIRILVGDLERHASVALARPFNKGYERQHLTKDAKEAEEVRNGSLAYMTKSEEEPADATAVKSEEDVPVAQADTQDQDQEKDQEKETKVEVDEDDKPKTDEVATQGGRIYTTTHYVGLELAEGTYPARLRLPTLARLVCSLTLKLVANPNLLICQAPNP